MAKAVALLSGGLDSTLAVLVLLRQNIEITAVTFQTWFGCDASSVSSCGRPTYDLAAKFGFDVETITLGESFIDIVKNPHHGHGKNMNPCIDCRILMLKEALTLMHSIGADFLVTGEVLGQRPMSQRRECFPLIDRDAGVEGYVLRPLCAKLLKPTIAEEKGLVDRAQLYAMSGRTRKPQMALAEELGLTEYPAPAGGCLLTDPIYSQRLKELLHYDPDASVRDISLLQIGRHFRLNPTCKAVVGRNEAENEKIELLLNNDSVLFAVTEVGSPTTLLINKDTAVTAELIRLTAAITARYSDAKREKEVEVVYWGKTSGKITVNPTNPDVAESFRIKE
ncbi:MAG: hypothetical protein HQK88_04505 [Nitrospirae bacterium]|nr:hypothetical protein [Nitrospirota bacterium]MBF0533410.1 hypothetical protein [Nitrospirota bacterium]MBF0616064.1 hypothetical protein [Nitrospirota bacterium]